MSTLRVSNIEAKADVSSPSVHEKIKVTNSEGDVLVHIDGATSGISTVGINTTVKTFDVDSNQNIDFVGNLTAPNITVTGTLSYDDVTNIDSVGVVTARDGLRVTGDAVISHTGANPLDLYKYGTAAPTILMYGANGTEASPTQTLSGDVIGGLNMFGYGSSGWAGGPSVRINAIASEDNGQTSNRGADIKFETVATGGVSLQERLRIKSNGYVGIGTDNPGHLLDLYNHAGSDCLRLNVNGGAGGSSKQNAIRFSVDGDVKAHMGLAVDAGRLISGSIANDFCIKGLGSNNILFATNSSEKVRITTGGNLGIGDASPTKPLTVGTTTPVILLDDQSSRTLEIRGPSTTHSATVLTTSTHDLLLGTNNTERLRITSGGQLLISGQAALTSTSLPHPIQVTAASDADAIAIIGRASDDISELSFYEADKTTNLGEIQYRQDHVNFRHRVGYMSFATGGVAERIRIKSNGVVQVANAAHGTDNGSRLLEVIGSGNSQAGFLIANNATSASGTCDITFAPSNKIAGAQIFCEAQEDFSSGANRTADLTFITRNDGTLAEKVRITSDGITQQKDLSGNYHVIASSRDGSTSARAATSAWEIKKTLGPDAKTGYYYLTNPYDSTTQQWWCDMETDGGGWILVAYNGDGQMASNPGNWYDRQHKGGFNGLTQGFYRGGGYWNTWGDLKGQLMWECRTLDTYFNSSSCSKVGINWGKTNNLPTAGTRAYGNITGNGNTLFENWCWDIYNAPGFEPSNYEQHARNNRIGGNNNFTEHMVITWSFRDTSGSADDGSSGPYWMIGAHHDGLHQHYEESLSGSDGVNGDGGYQVCSNEDTSWGGGGQQHSMNRLARHSQNGGSVFVWMR